MNTAPTLVLDLGSSTMRCGLAGSDKPDLLVSSAFPASDHSFPITEPIPQDCEPDFAIVDAEVENENRMTFALVSMFDHYFPNDQAQPDTVKFAMTDMPLSSKRHSAWLAQQVFEMLCGDQLTMRPPAVYSLTASSLPTAVCLDIGYDICHTSAIVDHFICSKATQRSFLAGSALDLFTTRYAMELPSVTSWGEMDRARLMKETRAHVVMDMGAALDSNEEDYNYTCGEILFNPALMEAAMPIDTEDERVASLMEEPSLAQMIATTIENCDLHYRGALWNNIIVTGGTSKMTGLKDRLMFELKKIAPVGTTPIFRNVEDPSISAWQGAALTCGFTEGELSVSREEYDEDPNVVFTKFTQYGIQHYTSDDEE